MVVGDTAAYNAVFDDFVSGLPGVSERRCRLALEEIRSVTALPFRQSSSRPRSSRPASR